VPVAQSRGHAGKALVVAGVAVVVLVAVAFGVAALASRGDVDVRLGDDRFDAGQVENIAEAIAEEDGLPLLYPDLVNRDRHLFVQHLGRRDAEGWAAFGAFDPDEPECVVELDREARLLRNACDEARTYPLDGRGLRYYPTAVEDGRLYVDINELTTTTAAGRP
jgi:hypothetical protein